MTTKQEKRIEQVIKHLLGTELPITATITDTESKTDEFITAFYKKMYRDPSTLKWKLRVCECGSEYVSA